MHDQFKALINAGLERASRRVQELRGLKTRLIGSNYLTLQDTVVQHRVHEPLERHRTVGWVNLLLPSLAQARLEIRYVRNPKCFQGRTQDLLALSRVVQRCDGRLLKGQACGATVVPERFEPVVLR